MILKFPYHPINSLKKVSAWISVKFRTIPRWPKPRRKRRLLAVSLVLLMFLAPLTYLTLQAPEAALADSLLKFDEGYGTTINDSSGSASGTITGATWKTSDLCMNQKCLFFDGSDWISFGDEASFDFAAATDFTIEFWFRHGTASAAEVIIQKYEGVGADGGYRIQMESDGDISFGVDDANGGFADDNIVTTAANYDNNRWHHVSAVKDGTTGIYLYIDSVLIVSDTTIGSTGDLTNNDTFYIGDSNGADGGDEYIGFLDEVKIYTSTARTQDEINADVLGATKSRGTSASFGPDYSYLSEGLVGYWPMDETSWTVDCSTGSVLDSSGNGYHGASCPNSTGPAGGATGKFGNGGLFDGSNDYVGLPSDVGDFGTTQDFTVSAWINTTGDVNDAIFGNATSSENYWMLYSDSTGKLRYYNDDPTNGDTNVTGVTTIDDGSWHHVAMVRKSSGTEVSLYVDGSEDINSTGLNTSNTTHNSATIGQYGGGAHYFNGTLDDVRIYNRAFSPAEVSALYNWAPGPVGYWQMDENTGTGTDAVKDTSGNDNHGDMSGTMTESDWVPGRFGSALDIDGTNDYVSVASPDLPVDDFTYSAWINLDANTDEMILMASDGSGLNEFYLRVTSASLLRTQLNNTEAAISTGTLSTGQWIHVAVKRSGSNVTQYINGAVDGTGTSSATLNFGSCPLLMGTDNDTSGCTDSLGNYLDGQIDEVKVYNYERTPSQIIEDMNAGHPAPGSPVGSPVGHWKFDEGYGDTANDSGTGGNNGNLAGGTTCPQSGDSACPTWTNDGKFGKALDFDPSGATDDYVTMGDVLDFERTDPFSISVWVKSNSATITNAEMIVAKQNSASPFNGYSLSIRGDKAGDPYEFTLINTITTDSLNIDFNRPSDTSWHHVLATYDGSSSASGVHVYVEGVEQTKTVVDDNLSATTLTSFDLQVGARNGTDSPFDGTTDEVKIYNVALTADQVKIDMNKGSAASFGDVANQDNEGFGGNAPIGWWKMDENTGTGTDAVKDTSGNDNHGTMEASMTESDWVPVTGAPRYANGLGGSALDFDGSNDDVDIGDISTFDFGTGNFTATGWFKASNLTANTMTLINKRNSCSHQSFWSVTLATDGTLGAEVDEDTGGTNYIAASSTRTVDDGKWHSFAAVRDANTLTLYVDGTFEANGSAAGTANLSNSASLKIGERDNGSCTRSFPGHIDELKVYNYARSQAQVAYDFNRGKPVGYWKLDDCTGTNADDSGSGDNDGTITIGAGGSEDTVGTCETASTAWGNGATGKRNASLDFDGTDDYISHGNVSTLNFERTDSFSASAWIKRNTTNTFDAIVSKQQSTGDKRGWLFYGNDDATLALQLRNTGDNSIIVLTTDTFDTNWHHVAFTYDGSVSPDGVSFYIDGDTKATTTAQNDLTATIQNSVDVNIGDRDSANSLPFDGLIDDVRIYNYPLTADQVKRDFNNGAQFFGPATGSP